MMTIIGWWLSQDKEGRKVLKPQPHLSLEKTGAEVDEDEDDEKGDWELCEDAKPPVLAFAAAGRARLEMKFNTTSMSSGRRKLFQVHLLKLKRSE
eukprot:scaffold27391_cov67-Attheya_sp.AAC.8